MNEHKFKSLFLTNLMPHKDRTGPRLNKMAQGGIVMDVNLIRSMVDALAGSAAAEVHVKTAGMELRLRFAEGATVPAAPPRADLMDITASLPGTVYLAPAPGSAPFAAIGATIGAGDTLLLVEAMKSMLPLTAPRAGIVAEVLVQDEATVTPGQVLIRLAPVPA